MYRNFLTLSIATEILLNENYAKDEEHLNYAAKLLITFVKHSIHIYGYEFVCPNVHSLLHSVDCVRRFGSLETFSAFPFENYMQQLKRKLRKSHKPLQQVVRRTQEEENLSSYNIHKSNNAPEIEFICQHMVRC